MAETSILVVDDDPHIRKLFSKALTHHGYGVSGAPDGESAMANLKSGKPEVIFLDLKLPGMNGVEVLEVIRRLHPDVPVVIITGYPRSSLVDSAIRMGIFACLVKPFGMADVLAILESLGLAPAPKATLAISAAAQPPTLPSRETHAV